MSARTMTTPHRRGACPGLSKPMQTGDGMLVRLFPTGTIPLTAFAALCEAARIHGNGIIEITSRGSIQIRGLSEASAPQFAKAVVALDIAAEDGVPVLCNALAGLDAEEIHDCTALAAELRHVIALRSLAERLSQKVSIVIDGGGTIGLATIAADIRLRAEVKGSRLTLRVSAGGDEAGAIDLGHIATEHGIGAAMRLLDVVAQHGRDARARDVLAAGGVPALRSAISEFLLAARPAESGAPGLDSRFRGNERKITFDDAIGAHALRGGKMAHGIGLAFGHTNASTFERLAETAKAAGASGLRTAPGRALLAIGLAPQTASAFAESAGRLGFIVRADDPRRNVIACAGAPVCASAYIASRLLAPLVAEAAARRFDGKIHISGCSKGCAHAAPAALTVVGTPEGCALIAEGSVRDAPFALLPTGGLPQAIATHIRERSREAAYG